MNIAYYLSVFVFVITIITLLFAVGAYVVYKYSNRKKAHQIKQHQSLGDVEPVLLKKFELPHDPGVLDKLSKDAIGYPINILQDKKNDSLNLSQDIASAKRPRGFAKGVVFIVLLLAFIAIGSYYTDSIPCSWAGDCDVESISKVYLLESEYTYRYFTTVQGNYEQILKTWRDFLTEQDIAFIPISDQQLETGIGKSDVLILPGAVALSTLQRKRISEFIKNGGNLLSSWINGVRDESGDWLGWDFMKYSLDLDVEEMQSNISPYLFNVGRTPVTYSLSSGTRVSLGNSPDSLLRFGEKHEAAAVYKSWAMQPLNAENPVLDIAITYREKNDARMVAIGFSAINWHEDIQNMKLLIRNALTWLMHEPAAVVSDWPQGNQASLLIAIDAESQFENSIKVADIIAKNAYKGTFFSVTEQGIVFPDVLRYIAEQQELAFHGDKHIKFRDMPATKQAKRLDDMIQSMQEHVSASFQGFRAPYEEHDAHTERLLRARGIEYIVANINDSKSLLPRYSDNLPQTLEKGLLVFTRTMRDDVFLYDNNYDFTQILSAMNEDLEIVYTLGGLAIYVIHTQTLAASEEGNALLNTFLKNIQAKGDIWVATGKEINQWWRNRNRTSVKLQYGIFGTRITIKIAPPGVTSDVTYLLINEWSDRKPIVSPLNNAPRANVQLLDSHRSLLITGQLAPGEYSYSISY